MSDSLIEVRVANQTYRLDVPVNDTDRDAAARINDAFQLGKLSGACAVILPPGVFWCKQQVQVPASCLLLGSGPGTVLKAAPGLNADLVVDATGAGSVRIQDLIVDGNASAQTSGHGIALTSCDDARLTGVVAQNCRQSGVYLSGCNRPVLEVVSAANGAHGVHLSGCVGATGNVVARDNGQISSGSGLYMDAATTDTAVGLYATDTRTSGSKTQLYGAEEAAASNCDRNNILGSLNGNATGPSSLVGTSSKLVSNAAVVQTTGTPTPVGTAGPGSATNAPAFDHGHALAAGACTGAALGSDVLTVTGAQAPTNKTFDSTSNIVSEIQSVPVTGSVAASIVFNTIPQGYRQLMLVLAGASDVAANMAQVRVQFNGDTGANYDYQFVQSNGSTTQGGEYLAAISGYLGNIAGSTAPANAEDTITLLLANYTGTTAQKHGLSTYSTKQGTTTGNLTVGETATWWRNTAAITQITLFCSSGNFAVGTIATLYGMA